MLEFIEQWIAGAVLWIEMGGSVIVAFGCLRAVLALVRSKGIAAAVTGARLMIADAVLWGLSFKVAAALLKTAELRSWNEIAAFAAILTLRTLLKRALIWEEGKLRPPPPN